MSELFAVFGSEVGQRGLVSRRLQYILFLVYLVKAVRRIIIFGSYVSDKVDPDDVDLVLIMDDGFRLESCDPDARVMFDHVAAQARLGASIFWVRPSMLLGETVESFVASWQVKRDGTRRGIVEVSFDSER